MGKIEYNVNKYSQAAVILLGILGNIFVIISILRQKNMLKNNYYFLVLHLAICDLGALIIYLLDDIAIFCVEKELYFDSTMYCIFGNIFYVFQVAGLGMMLIISVLRYRATVHPLKIAINRRKLKDVCHLVYIIGFVAGYGAVVPSCWNDIKNIYLTYHLNYVILCYYILPSIFMAVVYFKISRALFQQNKFIKSLCSSNARQGAPSSVFNTLRFIRNRKVVFVCLATVLCFVIGNIPITVVVIWYGIGESRNLVMKYNWVVNCTKMLRNVGTHSANPLIYGILDKKLRTFWKLCRSTKSQI